MLYINEWYGRFGNNILQIIRAIHIGINYKYKQINLPNHNFIITKNIVLNSHEIDKKEIRDNFFNIKKYNLQDPEPYVMKNYFNKYIKNILKINYYDKDNYDSSTLHIHIRSGDIFKNNPHPFYVPPPMYYYKKIIENNSWTKIIVVYEDDKNPCINLLKKNYNNICFQSKNLNDDLLELSKSKNLAIGFGTFGLLNYFLSNNIEQIFIPDYAFSEMPKGNWGIKINIINFPNYIKCGEWKITNENLNKVINYNI